MSLPPAVDTSVQPVSEPAVPARPGDRFVGTCVSGTLRTPGLVPPCQAVASCVCRVPTCPPPPPAPGRPGSSWSLFCVLPCFRLGPLSSQCAVETHALENSATWFIEVCDAVTGTCATFPGPYNTAVLSLLSLIAHHGGCGSGLSAFLRVSGFTPMARELAGPSALGLSFHLGSPVFCARSCLPGGFAVGNSLGGCCSGSAFASLRPPVADV